MTTHKGVTIPDFTFKPGMVIHYRGRKGTENVLEVLEVRHLFDTPGTFNTSVHYRLTFGHNGHVMEGWECAGDLVLEFSDAPVYEMTENLGKIIRIEEAEE